MADIFTEELVDLQVSGDTKADVIASLAGLVAAAGRTTDVNALIADVMAREAIMPTGFEGVAIRHARSAA